MNKKEYAETIALCTGAQNNKDVPNWTTLHEFDNTSKNKDFDAKVYKQGDRVVIAFAGSKIPSYEDVKTDLIIMKTNNIPAQLKEADKLYNLVKEKYGNANIEFMGYSLGGSVSNLMSHKTGLPSHAIAPIGSKHIADANKHYFKYDDSNITTYGKKGDIFFNNAFKAKQQSGKIIILPDLNKFEKGGNPSVIENHLLHNFGMEDLSKVEIYEVKKSNENRVEQFNSSNKTIDTSLFFGWKNPISGDKTIYTKEYIAAMSKDEFEKHKKEIEIQAQKIGIPRNTDMKEAQSRHGNVVHVRAYTKMSGVHVRDYYRSI